MLEAAVAEEQAERDTEAARLSKRREAEAASLAALERWKAALGARRQAEIEALKRQLSELGADPNDIPPPPRPTPSQSDHPAPATKDDLAFRRDVANQLAASWRATWSPERPDVREYLESAMWNVRGFQMIGAIGERVAFDGRRHECPTPVSTDAQVRVVRPGWLLEEADDAVYVVLKAVVEKPG